MRPVLAERGAVMIMTASFMLLGVLSLALVVDTGRLFVVKRNLQKLVDVAALEVASRGGRCDDGTAQQYAEESLARNGFVLDAKHRLALPECGDLVVENNERQLAIDSSSGKAISLKLEQNTPASIIAGGTMGEEIIISASALGSANGSPLAMLTLRSTLLNVNITKNSKAKLLSDVFGGLLGGNLNISVGAWNGLIHTDIDIFKFMDQLATNLSITAGEYDTLLSTNVSTGELIQAAIDVLDDQNGTPQVTINALEAIVALDQILLASMTSSDQLQLGELLGVGVDGDYEGAKAEVQLYQLIQGVILLANRHNAVSAVIPISVLGNDIDVAIKVIEPPQISAIGDPAAAKDERSMAVNNSPNRIYVRSAQLRLILSVSLNSTLTSLVSGLTTAITNLLSPLLNVVNSLLALDLGSILIGTRDTLDILVLPAPFRFDINLDLAGGDARVVDYSCQGEDKTLEVDVNTAAATLRIGKMGTSASDAKDQVMATQNAPTVLPVPLVDFGIKTCTKLLGLPISCGSRTAFAAGGLGLKVDAPVLGSSHSYTFIAPDEENLPDLGVAGTYVPFSSTPPMIDSLTATLAGPEITAYAANGNTLGATTMAVGSVINTIVGLLKTAVSTVLSPLLQPLITLLVENLGIDIATTEVAANLSCLGNQGVMLAR